MGAAVITGAGRGLGREIALRLASRGFAVEVTDLELSAATAVAAEVGAGASATALDVRDDQACRRVAAATIERSGSLDVWVNNAGMLVTGHVWEHEAELRRKLFEVNALGTINGTLAALEPMRAAGRGHVINVVSLAGIGAPPGEALYASTKHAALGFSLGALADLRRAGIDSVQISALCPDGIWTPMLYDKLTDPDAAPSFSGVLMDPATVAEAAAGLLDKPRPVLCVPRRRGAFVRLFATFPGLASRATTLWMRDASRRQARWRARIERGDAPGA